MKPPTYITTSWDDGHPLDLRVAELLTKYGLRGTFYVPRTAERGTMTAAHVRQLTPTFEVGAHTLDHIVLTSVPDQQAWSEIAGSKSWLEDSTGLPCLLFCPPKGRYARRHLGMVRSAGYLGLRSAEWVSLDFPRRKSGLVVMPTTLQAHPHGPLNFFQNTMKRAAFGNLWRFVVHGGLGEWPKLAQSLMCQAVSRGGVFHLWGHSWELQDSGQWQRLEDVLRFMSACLGKTTALTNGQICQRTSSRAPDLEEETLKQGRRDLTQAT
jgi:peptidoglycan-N-acetylglucosamine deacetylase